MFFGSILIGGNSLFSLVMLLSFHISRHKISTHRLTAAVSSFLRALSRRFHAVYVRWEFIVLRGTYIVRSGDHRRRNHHSTYTGILNQSNAVSCHFSFPFPGQVNFRLRAICLIFTLIIGKEDLAVGILGLNGKEDWPWDPTDEMNFQWKLRSRIRSVGAGGSRRGRRRNGERRR